MTPSGPIPAPGQPNPDFDPNTAGPGGGFPSNVPAQDNSGQAFALEMINNIVSSGRRLADRFPACSESVRNINNIVSREITKKVLTAGPSAEPMAPPM